MMPNNGRVLVIDDNFDEVAPLLKMLSKKEIPYMFFSGRFDELPDKPFKGIRIAFFDLIFSANYDEKTVIANLINLAKSVIHTENGPFIMMIWSKHEDDYLEMLGKALNDNGIFPEFILQLTKSDYFESESESLQILRSQLNEVINKFNNDDEVNSQMEENILFLLQEKGLLNRKNVKLDPVEEIGNRLMTKLRDANLFALFVLWENTINSAKLNTVTNLYQNVPNNIPKNKVLPALLHFMAEFKLENGMQDVEIQDQFGAAIETLNEFFYYFYRLDTLSLKVENIPNFSIIKDEDFTKGANLVKFNNWMFTTKLPNGNSQGKVYIDHQKIFEPNGLIQFKDKDSYDKNLKTFLESPTITYVFVEISTDCDIAQRRNHVSRIIPGVMFQEQENEELKKLGVIKGKPPNNFKYMGYIEIERIVKSGLKETKNCMFIFNLGMSTYRYPSEIKDEDFIIGFSKNIVINLQTELGKIISNQGIASFKK
jgi:hypothetical protein